MFSAVRACRVKSVSQGTLRCIDIWLSVIQSITNAHFDALVCNSKARGCHAIRSVLPLSGSNSSQW